MKRAATGLALGLFLAGLCSVAAALEVPKLKGRVTDEAGLLSEAARRKLESGLAAYEQETGHQFALLTVPSLEGDPIEDFSIRVVEQWKLGGEDKDDGLLMLVVPKDRAMRIEVGYGLEGDIPDAIAGRIVREVLTPSFRQGEFDGGITQAFELLMKAGRGGEVSMPATQRPTGGSAQNGEPRRRRGWSLGGILHLLFILGFFILPLFGRRRGGFVYLGGLGGGLGGGGFRSGGFGGGGFSGGGGGFGGGGASGSW